MFLFQKLANKKLRNVKLVKLQIRSEFTTAQAASLQWNFEIKIV